MPALIAFATGVVKAVFEMTVVAIPSALAEIAEFKKLIISESLEVGEPPHCGVGRPSSAAASEYPYFVGVKNSFVTAWLTNQNFHGGVFGKTPAGMAVDVADDVEVALLELDEVHAAISADAAAVALNSPAPSSS